jgi:hypothetical protein
LGSVSLGPRRRPGSRKIRYLEKFRTCKTSPGLLSARPTPAGTPGTAPRPRPRRPSDRPRRGRRALPRYRDERPPDPGRDAGYYPATTTTDRPTPAGTPGTTPLPRRATARPRQGRRALPRYRDERPPDPGRDAGHYPATATTETPDPGRDAGHYRAPARLTRRGHAGCTRPRSFVRPEECRTRRVGSSWLCVCASATRPGGENHGGEDEDRGGAVRTGG